MMPNGAELFSQSLKQLGVTHVFALVGDHLNAALQVLDRAQVIPFGIVLNDANQSDVGYGYGYGKKR